MRTDEQKRLEEIVTLARRVAAELAPLSCDATAPDALALRLAQAHALGLLDQLQELVESRDSRPSIAAHLLIGRMADEDVRSTH